MATVWRWLGWALIGACVGAGQGVGAYQAIPFKRTTYSVGSTVYQVAPGDFDGDRLTDVALGTESGVVVYSNLGKGLLHRTWSSTAEVHVLDLLARDLNGDEKLDLVLCTVDPRGIAVRMGKGDGTFGAAKWIPVGAKPWHVAAGDLRGKGTVDLVVTCLLGSDPKGQDQGASLTAAVLLGKGDGSFEAPQLVDMKTRAFSVSLGDFTGQGHLDMAAAMDGRVVIARGKGDGTFGETDVFPYPLGSSYLGQGNDAADFDGDGLADLTVANFGAGDVELLRAEPNGGLSPPLAYRVGRETSAVVASDLNADGRPDVCVLSLDPPRLSLLTGSADASLRHSGEVTVGRDPFQLAAADLTGDGLPDLLVALRGGQGLDVLINGWAKGAVALVDGPTVGGGDLNGDGITNLEDVQQTILAVLGIRSLPLEERGRADVTLDGRVDIGDVVATLAGVLGIRPFSFYAADDVTAASAALDRILRVFWTGAPQSGHVIDTRGGYPATDDPRGGIWERATLIVPMSELYQFTSRPDLRQRIASDWQHVQQTLTLADRTTCGRGTWNYAQDDAAWAVLYYLVVHRVTGDAEAISNAKALFVRACNRWVDDQFGGGAWYSDQRQFKSLYQAALILAGLQLYEATQEGTYLDQALSLYDWVEGHLLRTDGAYWCDYGFSGPVVGGAARMAGSPTFLGGMMAMGAAHGRLYRLTGQDLYRQRALRTADAVLRCENDGYGRLLNDRDAWTDGFFMGDWVREVLSLPGIRTAHKRQVLETAHSIRSLDVTAAGYLGGCWSGPAEGDECPWWKANSRPEQIMTSGSALGVLVAAGEMAKLGLLP